MIVKDSEFLDTANSLEAFAETLLAAADQYGRIIDLVLSKAIVSGKTHDALMGFRVYMQKLSVMLESFGGKIQGITKSFLTELDVADEYHGG